MAALVATLAASQARAQPRPPPTAEERIAAQALFEQAKQLVDEGDYAAACPKLEESQRLDPAIGTQFRLGDCYELGGRLASAWIQFVDVAAAARAQGQGPRELIARRRAAALEPRLGRLRVEVPHPVAGLEVSRNGSPLPPPQWSLALPVDPGRFRIEASAPGHQGWRRVVRVRGEGRTFAVEVPALEPLPAGPDAGPSLPPLPDEASGTVRKQAALGMGVAALVGVATGAVAGIWAISKKNESEAFCPEPGACYQQGLDLRAEARAAAGASTVGFGVGAGALLGAAVLWLSAPEPLRPPSKAVSARLVPVLAPAPAGALLGLRWAGP